MGAMPANATAGDVPAVLVGPLWRERLDRPIYDVTLWPNQSLTRRGHRMAMGTAAAGLSLPLFAVAGTPVFWGLAPFLLLAFGALWLAIRRNGRHLRIQERLTLWRDEVRVERREPNGRLLRWQAEPLRVRLRLHKDGKVEDYLTLAGGAREIELGAFLAPEERVALATEIEAALTRAVRA
jgi:uncharacterized membrane protein